MVKKIFDQSKFERRFRKTLKDISKQKFAMSDDSYNTLTNDAKFLITKMYEEYINRRKNKVPKEEATYFGSVPEIHRNLMPEWLIRDVQHTCVELESHGFIAAIFSSGGISDITLTTEAISKSEQKFKDNLNEVLEYASKIKSLIPFI